MKIKHTIFEKGQILETDNYIGDSYVIVAKRALESTFFLEKIRTRGLRDIQGIGENTISYLFSNANKKLLASPIFLRVPARRRNPQKTILASIFIGDGFFCFVDSALLPKKIDSANTEQRSIGMTSTPPL